MNKIGVILAQVVVVDKKMGLISINITGIRYNHVLSLVRMK
jgi:hypothetical protein